MKIQISRRNANRLRWQTASLGKVLMNEGYSILSTCSQPVDTVTGIHRDKDGRPCDQFGRRLRRDEDPVPIIEPVDTPCPSTAPHTAYAIYHEGNRGEAEPLYFDKLIIVDPKGEVVWKGSSATARP